MTKNINYKDLPKVLPIFPLPGVKISVLPTIHNGFGPLINSTQSSWVKLCALPIMNLSDSRFSLTFEYE